MKLNLKHRSMIVVTLLICISLVAGCGSSDKNSNGEIKSKSFFIFDTVVTVKIYDERADDEHFAKIEEILEEIDAKMNRNLESSELAQVNASAGKAPVEVSEETLKLVERALYFAELSDGHFDPTVGPLVDLWGIGGDSARVPGDDELRETLELVDYRLVEVDADESALYLTKRGMSLDLGAIAKGYAGDRIAAYLAEQGFDSAIIDLGGNILATGVKPDGSLWTIGVQDPDDTRGTSVGTMKVNNKTVVSSGVYERYFIEDGVRYHHILDTTDGYPVDNELLSVTIVTTSSTDADALSTAVFSMGLEDGLAFVESLDDVEAVFITEAKQVVASSGLRDVLVLTLPDYEWME